MIFFHDQMKISFAQSLNNHVLGVLTIFIFNTLNRQRIQKIQSNSKLVCSVLGKILPYA